MVLTELLGICRGFRDDGRIRKLVRVAELVRRGGRHDAVSRIRGHRRSCKGKLVMLHVASPRCSVSRCRLSYVVIDEGGHAGDVEALLVGYFASPSRSPSERSSLLHRARYGVGLNSGQDAAEDTK